MLTAQTFTTFRPSKSRLTGLARLGGAAAFLFASACGGAGDAGVTAPPSAGVVASVAVSGPGGTLQVGQAYQFSATPRDRNGATLTGVNVTWSVSPASAATVNLSGIVSPLIPGAATVTAAAGAVSGNAGVTFIDAPPPLLADVLMSGEIFLPFNTTIKVNGVVKFNFPPGIAHNVIFDRKKPGAPADILQTQNVIISRTFATIGTFPFDCTIHPGMTGQITVVP